MNPYLNFRGETRAAMEFYSTVFGGELILSTYGELGGVTDPAEKDLIMHSQLVGGLGFVLMAADVPGEMEYVVGTNNFSVALSGDEEDVLSGYFEKLSDGAEIGQPLTKSPWGASFGMLRDKFGISWLVNISGPNGMVAGE